MNLLPLIIDDFCDKFIFLNNKNSYFYRSFGKNLQGQKNLGNEKKFSLE